MNEKFSELAANIPELVEAMASGKRPTKGEIVKASIARHQEQERRIRELLHEVQTLRSNPESQVVPVQHNVPTSAPEVILPGAQNIALPYQIQTSHPIGVPNPQGHLWLGQLLHKANDPIALPSDHQPMSMLPDMSQPVSPFKQTSMMMNWSLSSLQQPLDPASLEIGIAASDVAKGLDQSGTLDYLGRHDVAPSSASGYSSPTFTASDSDSFSTEGIEPSLHEKKFLAENMTFEPFAIASSTVEQTPLASLVGLPATEQVFAAASGGKKSRRSTSGRQNGHRSVGDAAKEDPSANGQPIFSTLLSTSLPASS